MIHRLLLLTLTAALMLSGCKTRPSAVIYDGNGPGIHYHSPETAGGPMIHRNYR